MRKLVAVGVILMLLAACQPETTFTPTTAPTAVVTTAAPKPTQTPSPTPTPTVVDDETQIREFMQFYWDTYWKLLSDPTSPMKLTYKIASLQELAELQRSIMQNREEKIVAGGRIIYRGLKIGKVQMKDGYPTSIVTYCSDNAELTATKDGKPLKFPKSTLQETATLSKFPDGRWVMILGRNVEAPC